MEQRIKELEKQIAVCHKKLDKVNKKFEKAKTSRDNDVHEIQMELRPLNEEHSKLVVELWIDRGNRGLNKGLYTGILGWGNLPDAVKSDYYEIRNTVRHGCTGDYYDGCRGCESNCEREAEQIFLKKFGFR